MPTGINYLDELWSPVTGCQGKGCKVRDNCWAASICNRFPVIHGVKREPLVKGSELGGWEETCIPFDQIQFHPDRLDQPLHWRKPRRIGVCFTGDLFDGQVKDKWIFDVFMKMVEADQHQYFLLTKQPKRMFEFIQSFEDWESEQFPYIHFGVSITDQEDADRMLPDLLKIPGKHWVSWEPGLGPVDFKPKASWSYRMLSKCYGDEGDGGVIFPHNSLLSPGEK